MTANEIFNTLKSNPLFNTLSDEQLNKIIPFAHTVFYTLGEYIIRENDPIDNLYVLIDGEAEVLKKDDSSLRMEYRITLLQPGAVIGELSLLDNAPRSAAVRVTKSATALLIPLKVLQTLSAEETDYLPVIQHLEKDLNELKSLITEKPIYHKLSSNAARQVSQRLRATDTSMINNLRSQLILEKKHVAMGYLLINLITLIAFYSIGLGIIRKIATQSISTTFVGIPILFIFAAATYIIIKKNPYPLRFYGITLHNWRQSLMESIVYTLPILLLIVFIKYIVITYSSVFHNEPLFNLAFAHNLPTLNPSEKITLQLASVIYILLIPLQELLYRGFLQGSLQEFLSGRYNAWLAIIISNLIFSLTHQHVSLVLALMVFFPGIFWGWMYARHRTLIGVCVSHLMVGIWTFFIVGIDFFLVATK